MSAATIFFSDIVGFSKKPTSEQKRLVEALTAEVATVIKPLLKLSPKEQCLIALPTGDGIALAFLHCPNQRWDHSTVLSLIIKLHQWANNISSPHNNVSLRIGIHVGAVEIVKDINGKPNVCGDTINYTQRVMDAANPRQTLYSESAFREYIGNESPFCNTSPFSNKLRANFHGPIEVFAKHGLQIPVYKIVLEPLQQYCTNEDPVAKQFMLVTNTPLPKEIVGSFSEQINNGTHIAFIQLTGDRFISNFNDGKRDL